MTVSTSIITVANQKGGVGKTTTVVNLAASYANIGKKVLIIDLDYQANATSLLGIDEEKINKKGSVTHAIRNELPFDKILVQSNMKNLDVVGATRDLDDVKESLIGQPNQFKIVDTLLATTKTNEYDIILIDTHPSLDCFLQSALASSHYYLIPLFPEADSSRGVGHQIQAAEKARRYLNPRLTFLGCVIARFDRQNATHIKFESVLRQASKDGKFRVFATVVPSSNSVAAAAAQGMALNQYKKNSPITLAYSSLAGEILPLLKGKRTGRAASPIRTKVLESVGEIEMAAEL